MMFVAVFIICDELVFLSNITKYMSHRRLSALCLQVYNTLDLVRQG